MTDDDLCWLAAEDQAALIRAKALSPVEATRSCIARIEALNPRLNAFCTPMFDIALDIARQREAEQMRGAFRGPLHGVPYAIKDSDDYAGVPTLVGSRAKLGNVPAQHSPIVERMQAAGAVPLGKTTTPDMAWIGLTYSALHGVTPNPWDLRRNAGGSSGGSAVAVAAGMTALATGTDGAGSVRIPASFCGIFGHKPSFGRIPADLPNMNLHTHYGPLSRYVRDAALMMEVCSGPDDRDQYSLETRTPHYLDSLEEALAGLRLAWSPTLGVATRVDAEVLSVCRAAAWRFAELGAEVIEAEIDLSGAHEIAKRNWQAVMNCIVFHVLDGHEDVLDPALVACARGAAQRTVGEFLHDRVQMRAIYQRCQRYFESFDLILSPTVACLPLENGHLVPPDYPDTNWDWLDWAPYSSPFNAFHNPAASVPAGWSESGLPIGLQIAGPRFGDLAVLHAARAYEKAFPWQGRRPSL